jgi:hypothetical protein
MPRAPPPFFSHHFSGVSSYDHLCERLVSSFKKSNNPVPHCGRSHACRARKSLYYFFVRRKQQEEEEQEGKEKREGRGRERGTCVSQDSHLRVMCIPPPAPSPVFLSLSHCVKCDKAYY